ncbi:MAG: DUF58 domain-containing protein [Lachnospiraceae bacterium]|nr:DUF58 domain-containing protein [Lachnospiraceae bacterium]
MISFWNLLLIMAATVYVALMYNNPAILLLVYMEAVLFVLSAISLLVRRHSLRVELEVPVGMAESGGETLVKLNVRNKGISAVARVRVLLVVKDSMRRRKRRYWMTLPAVPKGETEFIRSVVFYGTGNYEVQLKCLRIYDMTGLLHTDVRAGSMGQVQVLPQLHDVAVRLTSATQNFYGESDVYDEHSPGYDNSELFQVREYRAGDRLQNVHWKLTAKQDEIMVKEHSLPKACPVLLFLNYRPHFGKRERFRLLAFLETAASLSFSIMDAGCPHYVVWYDTVQKDVMRLRIDEEESLFYFLGLLMKIHFGRTKENLLQRYQDKYRMEPYVWVLSLNEHLQLKKGEELLTKFSAKKLEKSLSQIELLL